MQMFSCPEKHQEISNKLLVVNKCFSGGAPLLQKQILTEDVDKMGLSVNENICLVSFFQYNKHVESGREVGSIV